MYTRDWTVPRWVKKMGMERQVEVVKKFVEFMSRKLNGTGE